MSGIVSAGAAGDAAGTDQIDVERQVRAVLLDGAARHDADLAQIDGVVDLGPGQFFVAVLGGGSARHGWLLGDEAPQYRGNDGRIQWCTCLRTSCRVTLSAHLARKPRTSPRCWNHHESFGHRQRRARARPGLEAGAIAARRESLLRPGNAGTALDGVNVPIEPTEFDKLIRFAKKEEIGLTVVGPEDPLAAGIVDAFQKEGLRIFGPTKAAARIEGEQGLRQDADAQRRHADRRIQDFRSPRSGEILGRVARISGRRQGRRPGGGQGRHRLQNNEEAKKAIERIMIREEFGAEVGRQIVIEKRLEGEELSVLALVSGRAILPLPADAGPQGGLRRRSRAEHRRHGRLLSRAEGHARTDADDRDRGFRADRPCHEARPLPVQGLALRRHHADESRAARAGIQRPLRRPGNAAALDAAEERPARSAGSRRRRKTGRNRSEAKVEWDPRPAVCVVLCSGGYPGKYETGKPITGLDEAARMPNVKVFHAGTKLDGKRIVTDGGRVLGVTALGDTLAEAKKNAYEAVGKIKFTGMHFRTDISDKALKG